VAASAKMYYHHHSSSSGHGHHHHHQYDDINNAQQCFGPHHHQPPHARWYHHNEPPKILRRTPSYNNHHVPFAQRIMCETNPQQTYFNPGVARVHSFTTRVYVNPDQQVPTTAYYPSADSSRLNRHHSQRTIVFAADTRSSRRPASFAERYHSAERPAKRSRRTATTDYPPGLTGAKCKTLPPAARFHSDERPPATKRLKKQHQQQSDHVNSKETIAMGVVKPKRMAAAARLDQSAAAAVGSSSTLPNRAKNGPKMPTTVSKTASFHFSSPFQKAVSKQDSSSSLTSKLQDQSMGIHRLIFDRLNNNKDDHNCSEVKCQHLTRKLLTLEEQRKIVKFRRFISAAQVLNKAEFLTKIEIIRRRLKREARRSIVDEHGIPAARTQLR
jgi:hypothetical protein